MFFSYYSDIFIIFYSLKAVDIRKTTCTALAENFSNNIPFGFQPINLWAKAHKTFNCTCSVA